jgi:hypothetical protein
MVLQQEDHLLLTDEVAAIILEVQAQKKGLHPKEEETKKNS